MTKKITISPTSIKRFFTCPASYKLAKMYKLKAPETDALAIGTAVHAKLAGEEVDLDEYDPIAKIYYEGLQTIEQEKKLRGFTTRI